MRGIANDFNSFNIRCSVFHPYLHAIKENLDSPNNSLKQIDFVSASLSCKLPIPNGIVTLLIHLLIAAIRVENASHEIR